MSRYIDANKKLTITVYDDEHEEHIDHYMTIEEILDTYTSEGCPPTADAVEVVRCKDCKHYKEMYIGQSSLYMGCELHGSFFKENDYCSYGKRREDDKE